MSEGEHRDLLIDRQAHRLAQRRGQAPTHRGGSMGAILNVFPLIVLPMLIYVLMALGSGLGDTTPLQFRIDLEDRSWLSIPVASREDRNGVLEVVQWGVSMGDALVFLSMLLLFVELIKSTSTGAAAIFNHALSMVVFIVCLVAFLLHPAFATTTFFMIMVTALLDVLAGVVVTIISARRDVDYSGGR